MWSELRIAGAHDGTAGLIKGIKAANRRADTSFLDGYAQALKDVLEIEEAKK